MAPRTPHQAHTYGLVAASASSREGKQLEWWFSFWVGGVLSVLSRYLALSLLSFFIPGMESSFAKELGHCANVPAPWKISIPL